MQIFTKKKLAKYVAEKVLEDRHKFMESTARNAAKDAVANIVCMRTIATWRALLDEAEKQPDKYTSLAELIVRAGIKK